MRPRIKICGITNLVDARYCSGAGADYLGFIFFEPSPRSVDIELASGIREWIHGPECVGVFVDEDPGRVNEIAAHVGLDFVQLHGSESPGYCQSVQAPVIKVIRVRERAHSKDVLAAAAAYSEVTEFILLDTYDARLQGGTGVVFDWNLAQDVARQCPIFLAGGLTPTNVGTAIELVQPYAIDVSSGLESSPGKKDFALIDALFQNYNKL